ncbi:hypothetical protein [Microbulbifer sp. THAF38]|uniref:hypothetical protein n=1 Tax=Microbulbifer sp. THAF38 TaxID=2587856 RepID=UPI0012694CA0|nr:hypothetical protein [Microbulbifer sp. THAF38]QFT53982.1 hypothetical protein FIU95_05290 [Microbulbifer sp. THAF38]
MNSKSLTNKPRAPLQPVMRMMHSISPLSILFLFVVLLDVHLLRYLYTGDLNWVIAFGANSIVLGILLVFSYSYPLEETEKLLSKWDKDSIDVTIGFHAEVIQGRNQVRSTIQSRITEISVKYERILASMLLTVFGTLLAGYAAIFLGNFFAH